MLEAKTNRIASCMQQAIIYLEERPHEASYTDAAATAVWDGGLRFRVEGPNGMSVVTDMSEAVGGEGSAPSPGWVLRAALAACDATLVAMSAAREGIVLEGLEVTVDSKSDDRGLLGIGNGIPAGPMSARVHISIKAPSVDESRIRDVVSWADEHSPVGDALRRTVPTTVEVEVTS